MGRVVKLGAEHGERSAAAPPAKKAANRDSLFESLELSPQVLAAGGAVVAVLVAVGLWFTFGRPRPVSTIPADFRPPIPGPPGMGGPGMPAGGPPIPGPPGAGAPPGMPPGGPPIPGPPGGMGK